MKNAAHVLLWTSAILAVIFVIGTDPWFHDNWIRIVMVLGCIFLAFLFGLLVGLEEGEKRYSKKIRGEVEWK